ncbi:MAG TPA: universal stress protein [Polyangiaceae bacterium]|jgi:nucleotide-binding universal stress UspA family protein|nr:universal stress protein [Polyangiaceae bacterium]
MATSSDTAKPFTILVGVDYSEASALALERAMTEAAIRRPSRLHVVHVMPATQRPASTPGGSKLSPIDERRNHEFGEELRRFIGSVAAPTSSPDGDLVEQVTAHIRFAGPADSIAQLASDLEANLVVVGTHGHRGLSRLLLGSVAAGVVRLAPCPVLVVRPVGAPDASKIPDIEPPCPRCVETRRATDGRELWCEEHRHHHDRRHTYHLGAFRSGHQSGFLVPPLR